MNQQAKRMTNEPTQYGENRVSAWLERNAGTIFLLPAILIVLFLSIFPLLISVFLSVSRIKAVKGGIEIDFIGLKNFNKILFGSDKGEFIGVVAPLTALGWIIFAGIVISLGYALWRYAQSKEKQLGGMFYRLFTFGLLGWLSYFVLSNVAGRPGSVTVTICYVLIGITIQYLIGLALALVTTQKLAGRRFFRVVYLLPMMITPVGVAYTFRMITDTSKGPFKPFFKALGLQDFTWVNDPWGARWAVLVGDIWQWTPFMFIVLLAAVEGLPTELFEAAHVDGASRLQIFFNITLPQLIPVSATVILIRMIEAFKIIDLPNVLTNGGPGTATQSLTLHAFTTWRAGVSGVGEATAIAYMLLFLATFIGTAYATLIHQRVSR
jgi:multiple sugar transport system permease protein